MFIDIPFQKDKTPAIAAGVLFFLLLNGHKSFSQNPVILNDYEHKVAITDLDGKAFVNHDADIAGSLFFLNDWKFGVLKINSNTISDKISLKIDLKTQEIHFLQSGNLEMTAPAGSIKEIILFDSTGANPVNYIFQCGLPAIDNQNENNLYLLICNGKIKLLKSIRKIIFSERDDLSGETKKEYRTYEDYYLYDGKIMQRIKRDKAFVLNNLTNQKGRAKTEQYANSANLNYKSTDDLKKIIDYYNSL